MGFFGEQETVNYVVQPTIAGTTGQATLVVGNCHELIEFLEPNSIQLALFSPPYDKLRDYKGGVNFDLTRLGQQLYRVMAPGGVVVMVIQDQTINFAKSLTSMRTIVNWVDVVGFTLFECLIYQRHGATGGYPNRFRTDHEYMPVFVKGNDGRPASFNKAPLAHFNSGDSRVNTSGAARRQPDGTVKRSPRKVLYSNETSRGTLWKYHVSSDTSNPDARIKFAHPATYPDRLAWDHVMCWTQPGDMILDPFVGSGSTAVAAISSGRNCIGFDVSSEYIELAEARCDKINHWHKDSK